MPGTPVISDATSMEYITCEGEGPNSDGHEPDTRRSFLEVIHSRMHNVRSMRHDMASALRA